MKIKGRRIKGIIVIIFSTVFLVFLFYFGESKAFSLSIDEEQILGEQFLANVRKHFDLVDDDFANEYINDLGHYLIKPLETKHFPFRFYIVKDNDLNAFAGPGGHIFFFSGLIEVMEEVDEFATVICHEIGHISGRHISQRIEQNKKIGIATLAGVLAGALIGGKAAGAITTGAVAAGIQKQLSYSRNDERHADQLGFKYTAEAGFDPSGMITTLKKLHQGQWSSADSIPSYLLTHPGGPERMSNIDIMLTNHNRKPETEQTKRFRELFPFFKTVLSAKYLDPHDAERLFNRELEKDPNSPMAHFGLGIVWKERSEYPRSINHFQKALISLPDSLPILRNLGEAYQLVGQDNKAITVLEKALEKDNQDRSSLFLLAASYQQQEEYQKAARLYERLTSMEPVKDEVYYNLGVSYGRRGNLARAHYNFGIYFKRLKKIRKARFHFQKAEDLAKDDPALRDRIRKAMKDRVSK